MKSSKGKKSLAISRKLLGMLAASLIAVTACAGLTTAVTPTLSFSSLSTQVAATLQVLTPMMSPTSIPIVIPPTLTPIPSTPTAAPPPQNPAPVGAIRIDFASGATASSTSGSINPGQVQNYLVRAFKGQPMIASIDTPGNNLTLSIYGLQSGRVLLPASRNLNSWQGILPATDDYVVQVIAGSTSQNFNLSLTIPSRISFEVGTYSATVSNSTQGGFNVTYALYALAGQTMDLNLHAPVDKAALEVWGFSDGQPYLRTVVNQTTFSMKLPASQDYIIAVVPYAGQAVDFTLDVKVK